MSSEMLTADEQLVSDAEIAALAATAGLRMGDTRLEDRLARDVRSARAALAAGVYRTRSVRVSDCRVSANHRRIGDCMRTVPKKHVVTAMKGTVASMFLTDLADEAQRLEQDGWRVLGIQVDISMDWRWVGTLRYEWNYEGD